MAHIQYLSRTESSISVFLSGLDTSYGSDNRVAKYYFKKSENSTYVYFGEHTLPKNTASTINGGVCTFTGLSPSTSYDIKVLICGITGGSISEISLFKTLWTLDAPPEIDDISCTVECPRENDVFYLSVSFKAASALEGTTKFSIYAKASGKDEWFLKSGKDIYYENIWFKTKTLAYGTVGIRLYDDEAFTKNYDIKLVAETNDEATESVLKNITVYKNLIREFKAYQDPEGEQSASFDFSYLKDDDPPVFPYYNPLLPSGSVVYVMVFDEDENLLKVTESEPAVGCRGLSLAQDYGRYICRLVLEVHDTDDEGNIISSKSFYKDDELTITANKPKILSFTATNGAAEKSAALKISLSNVIVGETEFKVYARKADTGDWWEKESAEGVIVSESFEAEITLDEFALYELKLCVSNAYEEAFETICFTPLGLWHWQNIYKDAEGSENQSLKAGVFVPREGLCLMPVLAEDFNVFFNRLNEVKESLGQEKLVFTEVKKGDLFTAELYNEAAEGVKSLGSGAGEALKRVEKGDEITAGRLLLLASELNAAILNLVT